MQRRTFLIGARRALLPLLGALMLVLLAAGAHAELKPIDPLAVESAQSAPPSAFGAPSSAQQPPSAFAAPSAAQQSAGAFGGIFGWVLRTQQSMQRELATGVKSLKGDNAFAGAVMLAALSFLYGVVHAIGPGHGKMVISSYVVANEETVRRGVVISFIAAGLQALTAVALVGILAFALNASGLQINAWSNQLEMVSYALIALVGAWLLATQFVAIFRRWQRRRAAEAHASHAGHDHSHGEHGHHHHHHGHADHHDADHHDHDHDHEEGEACRHIVDARELAGPLSWRKIFAVVFSVGIRPCTGAILVLIFALTQGVFWAGVAATFAMAIGTAITVAVLATLALGSRELALKLGGRSAAFADTVWTICTLGGSALILLFGATLFAASLGPARPF
jgi:ABC-type nickel/cobalt efflux system permease component RcnA